MAPRWGKPDSRISPAAGTFAARSAAMAQPRERPKRTTRAGRDRPFPKQRLPGRFRIPVKPLLGQGPLALSVAPVIEDKNIDSRRLQEAGDVVQPVADIAGIAVTPEQKRGPRVLDKQPAVELNPVLAFEIQVPGRRPKSSGRPSWAFSGKQTKVLFKESLAAHIEKQESHKKKGKYGPFYSHS